MFKIKKNIVMIVLTILTFTMTGCRSYAGIITDKDEPLVDPSALYSNKQGYILASVDIKSVSNDSGVTILNDFDFSGPLNDLYGEETGSPSSTIIVPEDTPEPSECINPNLAINPDTKLCAPMDLGECTPRVSSPFGPRWGTIHKGTDYAVPVGTNIYAIASGTVTISKRSDSAGNYISIDHEDTTNGIKSSVYMHNSVLLVNVGDYVQQGQLIAKSGNTGDSTGPHLHIGVMGVDGIYKDPQKYLPSNWP